MTRNQKLSKSIIGQNPDFPKNQIVYASKKSLALSYQNFGEILFFLLTKSEKNVN